MEDVLLPQWAHSPEDFIRRHREALVRGRRGGTGGRGRREMRGGGRWSCVIDCFLHICIGSGRC